MHDVLQPSSLSSSRTFHHPKWNHCTHQTGPCIAPFPEPLAILFSVSMDFPIWMFCINRIISMVCYVWFLWISMYFHYSSMFQHKLVLFFGWIIFLNSLFLFLNECNYFASVFRGWKMPTWEHFLIIHPTKYRKWAVFYLTWYLSYHHRFMHGPLPCYLFIHLFVCL